MGELNTNKNALPGKACSLAISGIESGREKEKIMEEYNVGNGPQQIKHATDITTLGLAASRAITLSPPNAVAHSNDATGDIPRTNIGTAVQLQGKVLRIVTKIDLSILPDDDAKRREIEAITARYILDDGVEGHREFLNYDSKQLPEGFNTVILFKEIRLT